jgi:hypothetical protein
LVWEQHSSGASSRGRFGGNVVLDRKDMAAPERYDYHLKATARAKLKTLRLRNLAADLQPDSEYIHPLRVRKLQFRATNPGALQTLVP